MSADNSKMYTLDYDPGHIEGHVVLKHNIPIMETRYVCIGTEWIEHDIGSWVGPQRIETPKYEEKEFVKCYKTTWVVYTQEEFKKFSEQFGKE
jgi:hypothetical protein